MRTSGVHSALGTNGLLEITSSDKEDRKTTRIYNTDYMVSVKHENNITSLTPASGKQDEISFVDKDLQILGAYKKAHLNGTCVKVNGKVY